MDESQFDLAALEEIDPSLEGGFKIQFDREIPIETRYLDKNDRYSDYRMLIQVHKKLGLQKVSE